MRFTSKNSTSNNGSVSILILCILSLLLCLSFITFGKYNITYKSVIEQEAITKSYYELNSIAQQYLFDLNNMLVDAEKQSIEYLMNQGYTYQSYEGVDPNVQHELNNLATNATTTDAGNKIVSKRIYTYYAYENISTLSDKYTTQSIVILETDGLIESIAIEINFNIPTLVNEAHNIGTSYLKIKISIMPFPYNFVQESNAKISLSLSNDLPLYKITSYENWYVPDKM